MTDDDTGDARNEGGGAVDDGTGDTSESSLAENVGNRFDRLPATDADRRVAGRVSRESVITYFEDRFGIPSETFEGYTFWEKGAGKIWVCAAEHPSPLRVEALGMVCLRTRQEHWKPTTDFAQRCGRHATECVIDLEGERAERFVAGEDQEVPWDGDWGYLIAAHEVGAEPGSERDDGVERDRREPLGIGLYVHGELRSMVPKGRRRDL